MNEDARIAILSANLRVDIALSGVCPDQQYICVSILVDNREFTNESTSKPITEQQPCQTRLRPNMVIFAPYRDDLEFEICQLDRFNQTSSAILTGFDPHPTLTVGFYLNPQLQDLEIVLRIATITKLTSSLAFSFQLFTRFAVFIFAPWPSARFKDHFVRSAKFLDSLCLIHRG